MFWKHEILEKQISRTFAERGSMTDVYPRDPYIPLIVG